MKLEKIGKEIRWIVVGNTGFRKYKVLDPREISRPRANGEAGCLKNVLFFKFHFLAD